MLCQSCQDILEAKSERIYHANRWYFKYHSNTRALRAAAEAGCQLCASLWYQLPERIHDAAALTPIDNSFDSCGEEALGYVPIPLMSYSVTKGSTFLKLESPMEAPFEFTLSGVKVRSRPWPPRGGEKHRMSN